MRNVSKFVAKIKIQFYFQ